MYHGRGHGQPAALGLLMRPLLNSGTLGGRECMAPYLHPHACFACRKSFRRVADLRQAPRPCPDCGAPTVVMNRKFKAPPTDDLKQWAKVRFLADHGFRFGSIVDEQGYRVAYPATLQEARIFVREYAHAATARWLTEDGPPKGKRRPSRNLPTVTTRTPKVQRRAPTTTGR